MDITTIRINVCCHRCSRTLQCMDHANKLEGFTLLRVSPCAYCLEVSRQEGLGRGYEDGRERGYEDATLDARSNKEAEEEK